MFVDTAKIKVRSGDGGNGAISFHREQYIANGGPDGGDGGRGGSIIFKLDERLSTLSNFRYKKNYFAKSGENGGSKNFSGKSAPNLIVKVPRGTLVKELITGKLIADISTDEEITVLRGGRGGFGNAHFATSVRQAPHFAKPGECGVELDLQLELKLLADVGLVGFPNVGKSTLISRVSEARPKISNYHFTTLTPVLGVVRHKGKSFVMADIPGIIQGAHDGVGLGHDFLKHIERCRLLLHVVDISGSEGRDPKSDFEIINAELEKFSKELTKKPLLVVGTKCDLANKEQIQEFRQYIESKSLKMFTISAPKNFGIDDLLDAVLYNLAKLPPIKVYSSEEIFDFEGFSREKRKEFKVLKNNDGSYEVRSLWLGKLISNLDFTDSESVLYLKNVLDYSGINRSLEIKGAKSGDLVKVSGFSFEYSR